MVSRWRKRNWPPNHCAARGVWKKGAKWGVHGISLGFYWDFVGILFGILLVFMSVLLGFHEISLVSFWRIYGVLLGFHSGFH